MDRLITASIAQAPTAWFAPTYKQLTEVWRSLTDLLEPVTFRRSEQDHRLELFGGGTIDMWSLDSPDTIRGRAYNRVVVNEASSVANLQQTWEQVIRPTLTDYRGDAWFPSTPRGFNFFKTIYDRGQDAEQPEWRSWTYPTAANPYIDPSEIEAAQRELPESVFSQEYLAAFIADESAVFRNLLTVAVLDSQLPIDGHQYVIGCDWGKLSDFSAFCVLDVTARQQVYLDRSNRIDYTTQVGRLRALYDRYHPSLIVAERNSIGEAIIEQLGQARLPVWGWTTTQATKQKMIEDLSLAFEHALLKLIRDPVQLAELQAFTASRLPSGLMRYAAPEGGHDDTVIALALAWQAARTPEQGQVRQLSWGYARG